MAKAKRVELEPAVRRAAKDRKTGLVENLKLAEKDLLESETEDAKRRARIAEIQAEIAEIEDFLARH